MVEYLMYMPGLSVWDRNVRTTVWNWKAPTYGEPSGIEKLYVIDFFVSGREMILKKGIFQLNSANNNIKFVTPKAN